MTYPAHVQGAPADERLLRWIARESQRSRFLRLAEDDRRVLAQRVVDDAADRLHEQGYYVTRMQNNEHFDLLVNGVRAEVKVAPAPPLPGGDAGQPGRHFDLRLPERRAPSPPTDGGYLVLRGAVD